MVSGCFSHATGLSRAQRRAATAILERATVLSMHGREVHVSPAREKRERSGETTEKKAPTARKKPRTRKPS